MLSDFLFFDANERSVFSVAVLNIECIENLAHQALNEEFHEQFEDKKILSIKNVTFRFIELFHNFYNRSYTHPCLLFV